MSADGPKRRLPAWMAAAPVTVKSTKVSVDLPGETDEQRPSVSTGDEPRRQRGRMKSDEDGKSVVADRRRGGRKRKSSEVADGAGDGTSNAVEDVEFGSKPKGRVPRRRRNVEVDGRRADVASLDDNGIELTVEDLLTIAEENIESYCKAPRSLGESTLESGSACTEKSSSEVGVEGIVAGADNNSGDPAREMLDLLLGPLLKRSL